MLRKLISTWVLTSLVVAQGGSYQPSYPTVVDKGKGLTYQGVYQSKVEAFLGIKYGQDTGGQNRYKPPKSYTYKKGATVKAQTDGPACPQPSGAPGFPLYLSNVTNVSEDCLLLNVKRPNGTKSDAKLPVMLFIHGGSFYISSKDELVIQPSGLILESVANGSPVIHVGINYRLGSFGFAQSKALSQEGSLNAGVRDQRLAIEWARDNIAAFGGDPNRITIFGQSSGGLAVGIQMMAYGGSKPVPFQQAICESQALEGGITGNFTRKAMTRFVGATTCNSTNLDSPATVQCLRKLSTQQLLDAQTSTYGSTGADNIGDLWMPTVDGDFLPDAPSVLVAQGRFAKITSIMGWTDDDINTFIPRDVRTASDSNRFLREYLPGFAPSTIRQAEQLYPVSEFTANQAANLTAEYLRTSRIVRDLLMVCMPFYYGGALNAKGAGVYYYDQNQTFLNPALTSIGLPNIGPVHTSEFAYVFGNLSHYDVDGFPFKPNASDYSLLRRESRSWSSFATWGKPSQPGKQTIQGWNDAYASGGAKTGNLDTYIIGGPRDGFFAITGGKNPVLNNQKLQKRCEFWNSPSVIKQLNY